MQSEAIYPYSKFDYTSLWWKKGRNAAVFQIGYHVWNNLVYKDIYEYMMDESYFMSTSIQIVLFKALQLLYNLVFARFTYLIPATRISKFYLSIILSLILPHWRTESIYVALKPFFTCWKAIVFAETCTVCFLLEMQVLYSCFKKKQQSVKQLGLQEKKLLIYSL